MLPSDWYKSGRWSLGTNLCIWTLSFSLSAAMVGYPVVDCDRLAGAYISHCISTCRCGGCHQCLVSTIPVILGWSVVLWIAVVSVIMSLPGDATSPRSESIGADWPIPLPMGIHYQSFLVLCHLLQDVVWHLSWPDILVRFSLALKDYPPEHCFFGLLDGYFLKLFGVPLFNIVGVISGPVCYGCKVSCVVILHVIWVDEFNQ